MIDPTTSFLNRAGLRRVPWGALVAANHLTFTTTSADRHRRAELGETAIAVLGALGVSLEQVEALDELAVRTPEAFLAELQRLQGVTT